MYNKNQTKDSNNFLMKDFSEINPNALSSVSIRDKSKLPSFSGVYFAIDSEGIVKYIGCSKNINRRFRGHNKKRDFQETGVIKIAWLEISDISSLRKTETSLISLFKPFLNGNTLSGKGQRSIEVIRTIKIPSNDLPSLIYKARIKDGRSVQVLATLAGISISYWYTLEKDQVKFVSEGIVKKIENVLGIALFNHQAVSSVD